MSGRTVKFVISDHSVRAYWSNALENRIAEMEAQTTLLRDDLDDEMKKREQAEAARDALLAVKDAAEDLAAMSSASWLDEAQESAREVNRLARKSEREGDEG